MSIRTEVLNLKGSLKAAAARTYRSVLRHSPTIVYVSHGSKRDNFLKSLREAGRVDDPNETVAIVDMGSGATKREGVIGFDIPSNLWGGIKPQVFYGGFEWPISDNSLDGVLSTAVLEHVKCPDKYVAEMFRTLKPGGMFLTTVPFMVGQHSSPSDYQRYTPEGLQERFSQFDIIHIGVECGPASALSWTLRDVIASLAWNKRSHQALELVASWGVQPIKYLDRFLVDRPYAYKSAAGLFIIGQKPDNVSNIDSDSRRESVRNWLVKLGSRNLMGIDVGPA